jgi:hypothetical protein
LPEQTCGFRRLAIQDRSDRGPSESGEVRAGGQRIRNIHSFRKSRALPGLQVVSEAMSPARVARTCDLVADGNDDLVIVINRAGAFAASARGREVTLCEGDAVLMSSSDIAALERSSFGGSLSLRIPRSLLSSISMMRSCISFHGTRPRSSC